MARSKSIINFSDLHIGSKLAVCSDDPEIPNYRPNKLQLALYDMWGECIDEITQKPEIKLINGEPFDGANKKQIGSQSATTNMLPQMKEAQKLIKQIPGSRLLFIKGSGYHVDVDASSYEEMLAELMGAELYDPYGTGERVSDFSMIRLNGKLMNFTHHVGYSKWQMYRTTAIGREMAALHFQYDQLGGKVDVISRGHVHYFVHVEFAHTHGFTTPAWKYPDRHLYRQGQPPAPDVGCVEIIVEPNGKIIIEKHIAELKVKPKVLEL